MTLVTMIVGAILLAAVMWWWASRSLASANDIAICAVLGASASAFNIIVPVPNVEITTTMVVCAALVLGLRMAFVTAVMAVIGTSITGGIGYWTAWQMLGYAVAALVVTAVARPLRDRSGITMLAMVTALVTIIYDVIVTVPGVQVAITTGASFASSLQGALLLGLPFTVVHVAASTALTIAVGPALIASLRRAQRRLVRA